MLRSVMIFSTLALVALVVGCGRGDRLRPATTGGPADQHDHHHHHHAHGPHDGHVVMLGNEDYHAEWLHDQESGRTTIYLLGSDAETEVKTSADRLTIVVEGLAEPLTYELMAANADDQGMASQFELVDPQLPVHLEASGEEGGVTATIRVEIDGQMVEGKVEEHVHEH